MQENDLHARFLDYLYSSYPRKRELTSILADILKIERESISRRLNGKVLFTVKEIGQIAEKMNISIDRLLSKKTNPTLLALDLMMPSNFESIDVLTKAIEVNKNKLEEASKNHLHIGYLFDSLPIEFYIPYENLSKFMYFKWIFYFVKNSSCKDFTSWQIPQQIKDYHEEIINYWSTYEYILYIWDNPVIRNLIKEVDLFYKMRILTNEEVDLIKKDIHSLLDSIETKIKDPKQNDTTSGKSMDLYISSINIGASCSYFYSSNTAMIQYRTPFLQTAIYEDVHVFKKIYEWINSMKKISTLISGSGAVERCIFFDEQHKIVDSI